MNNINKIIISLIVVLIFQCSGNKKNHQAKSEYTDEFIMRIENDAEFLVVGKPMKIIFESKDIYQKMGGFFIVNNEIDFEKVIVTENTYEMTITATEENLSDGHILIQVEEKIENDENITHEFLAPVKKSEKN